MLDHTAEILKQSALEEAEEPEPVPKERTMTVRKLAEWLELTDKLASRCLRTMNGTSSEQQQLDRELWGYLLHVRRFWRRRRGLYRQTSVLHFFKSSSGTRTSPPVLLDTGYYGPDDKPAVQEKVGASCLYCYLFVRLHTFCSFLGALAKWRKAIISVVMSFRLYLCTSVVLLPAPTGRIFMKFDIWIFF